MRRGPGTEFLLSCFLCQRLMHFKELARWAQLSSVSCLIQALKIVHPSCVIGSVLTPDTAVNKRQDFSKYNETTVVTATKERCYGGV